MDYAIGIVTYQPDIARLQENLKAAKGAPLILVDNGSENIDDIRTITEGTVLIENPKNLGIAAALNQLFRQAQALGCEWIVTLDQDSVIQPGMLEAFSHHTTQRDLAIICPRIEDRRLGRQHTQSTSGTEHVTHAMVLSFFG